MAEAQRHTSVGWLNKHRDGAMQIGLGYDEANPS